METALIFLFWTLSAAVIILTILGSIHISALTDRVTANAEAIRADIKSRTGK